MNSGSTSIKAKYQWTEAFLFLGMFAMVAMGFLVYSTLQDSQVSAIASQRPTCSWDSNAAPVTPHAQLEKNLIANGEMLGSTSELMPEGWEVSSWGNNLFNAKYNLEAGSGDQKSLNITMKAANSGGAMWQLTTPIVVEAERGYLFQNSYRSDVETRVVAEFTLNDGSKRYFNLAKVAASEDWKQQTITFVTPQKAALATVYQVINTKGFLGTDNYHLSTYQPKALARGMVSLTFDDGAEQIYENALPLFDAYNTPTTQYVVTKPIPDKHSGYYINTEQLNEFIDKGHEVGSHTSSHMDMAAHNSADSEAEILKAQKELYELSGKTATNFATPYGSYDARVIEQSKKYFCSHRSTDVGFNSPDNFDLYNIRVQNVTVDTPLDEIKGWVDYAERKHVWLVIVFHEIGYDGGTYSYTPQNLELLLKHLEGSSVHVTTMSDGIEVMQKFQTRLELIGG